MSTVSGTNKRSPSQSKDITTSSNSNTNISSSGSATTTTTTTILTSSSSSSAALNGSKTIQSSLRDSIYSMMRNTNNQSHQNANTSGRSPISPSRFTRLQEKEEMQNLNERLVIYIDTVRRLEQENIRLQTIVSTYSESSNKDLLEIKSIYEKELEDAKRLIDELAKEKAKFEIEVNKYKADYEETQAKLNKRDKEAKSLENKLKTSESEALEFKSRYEGLLSEQTRNKEELQQLRPHLSDLEKQLSKLKKQLEDETLLRVDLENKNQTLKEDLLFKSQIYDKEVDQLRSSKRVEIEQVDVRLRDEYDSRLVNELQHIREETESKIMEMKDEVERRFQNKLSDAEAQSKRNIQLAGSLKEELSHYKSKCEDLQAEVKSLQARANSNDAKFKELEDKLKKAHQKYEKDITEKDTETNQVRTEMQSLFVDYQELHDIKIGLDMEIAAYRKLLESEEHRLNISTSIHQHSQLGSSFLEPASTSGTTATTRGGKKRRMTSSIDQESIDQAISSTASLSSSFTQSSKSQSGIEILEHDFDGRCVKIVNKTDKEIPIGGWSLERNADNQLNEYKFTKAVVLKPGQTITVWSSNSSVQHDPPSDIVMSSQKWSVGDSMITVLADKDGNEQSRRESKKVVETIKVEKKLKSTPSKHVSSSSGSSSNNVSTSSNNDSKVNKFFNFWKN